MSCWLCILARTGLNCTALLAANVTYKLSELNIHVNPPSFWHWWKTLSRRWNCLPFDCHIEKKLLIYFFVIKSENVTSFCPRLCSTIAIVERGSSAVECRTRNQVSPGSNHPLLPFRRLGIFVLSIDAPVDSAVWVVSGYRQWWKCGWFSHCA